MSHSQFHRTRAVLRHAWLNLWDKHMTTGRINQVAVRTGRGHEGASPTWPLQSIETALPTSVYLQVTHKGGRRYRGHRSRRQLTVFPSVLIFSIFVERNIHTDRGTDPGTRQGSVSGPNADHRSRCQIRHRKATRNTDATQTASTSVTCCLTGALRKASTITQPILAGLPAVSTTFPTRWTRTRAMLQSFLWSKPNTGTTAQPFLGPGVYILPWSVYKTILFLTSKTDNNLSVI